MPDAKENLLTHLFECQYQLQGIKRQGATHCACFVVRLVWRSNFSGCELKIAEFQSGVHTEFKIVCGGQVEMARVPSDAFSNFRARWLRAKSNICGCGSGACGWWLELELACISLAKQRTLSGAYFLSITDKVLANHQQSHQSSVQANKRDEFFHTDTTISPC